VPARCLGPPAPAARVDLVRVKVRVRVSVRVRVRVRARVAARVDLEPRLALDAHVGLPDRVRG
tara:strand:+ start:339 stop:527 length:189 start_codon:yes stop_codon:yes gene_type:complete